MAVTHISEAEAARDFDGLMARVKAGEQVIIEKGDSPIALVQPLLTPHVRLLSESLRIAKERGSKVTLDGNFGADLEAAINSHPETLDNTWD